jgi:hypothetical protein
VTDDRDAAQSPDEVDRDAILARRRRFVVAALSSVAVSACASTQPMPCLSVIPNLPPDASTAESNPSASDTTDAGTTPTVVTADQHPDVVRAPPQPCLRYAR